MKVSGSRGLNSLSFFDDDVKSLQSSVLFVSKAVPSNHYSQQAFAAYRRAESRNRKLNLFADFDDSFDVEYVPRLLKPESSPTSKSFVTSRFPAALLSRDLEHKISMLNAFHQLEELTDTKPKRPVITRTNSSSVRRQVKRDDELSLLKKRLKSDNCGECDRSSCNCIKAVPDSYLKRMNRLFVRARRSISHSSKVIHHQPPSNSRGNRPQTSKSSTKRVQSNISYDRPPQSKLLSLLRSATEQRSFVTELVRNIDEVA